MTRAGILRDFTDSSQDIPELNINLFYHDIIGRARNDSPLYRFRPCREYCLSFPPFKRALQNGYRL